VVRPTLKIDTHTIKFKSLGKIGHVNAKVSRYTAKAKLRTTAGL